MGRRGSLLRAFTPHHNVYSHPKKNVESLKTRRKGESHVMKNNRNTKIIKLKYNKQRDEECSVDLSVSDIFDNDDQNNYLNNNRSTERNIMGMSMSTANTADMSVFSPIPIRSPTPQDKQSSQFHFDFDPGISLDLGIDFDPIAALLKQSAANMNMSTNMSMNVNMNTKSERKSPTLTDNDNVTAATDTELEHVRDWTSKRLTVPAPAESQKSYHDDADPDVNAIVDEHYNEYIARKFNRERIEQYLDFICPPPTEDEDVNLKQPKQLNQELRKSLFSRQGSKSEVEKSMKSIMGFSLEAGMMGSGSGKDLEFSIHDIKYDAYDNVNDDDDNNDPYLKHGFTSKVQNESRRSKLQVQIPSSINIMVEADNIDSDASTIADCSTSEGTAGIQQGSSSNKITPNLSERVQSKPDNQQEGIYPLELRKSYTHDTTTSPNGIDMFDQFINNANDNDNDDYNNLQKASHNQKVNFTRVTSPQQVNFSWATNPQPSALSEQKQASRQSLTMKYDSKDALIQLKSRLQKLTPDTPSCQSPVSVMMGMSSVASPNSYKSANIMKIKSRLRNIETQYNQIRVSGVVEGNA
jgi:hypothetical protein